MRFCRLRLASMASAGQAQPAQYDAIIVGGGTSGCLIAGRLGMENLKVLLIEEGADITKTRSFNWTLPCSGIAHRVAQHGYETFSLTTPQPNPLGGKPIQVSVPSPRVLGGSGVMGSCTWNLGDEADWKGTPWNFKDELLPHIRLFENHEDQLPHRGKRGKFRISRPVNFSPFFKPFCEAVGQDIPLIGEMTRPDFTMTVGCGRPDIFVDQLTGRAHTTLQRYIVDMQKLKRPVSVLCNSRVVGIRAASKRSASGVTFQNAAGELVDVNAPMVLLSAGAVGSAKLLLASRGTIDVDASVGSGFWDIPQVVLQYEAKPHSSHNSFLDPWVRAFLRADLRYSTPFFSLRSSYDDLVAYFSFMGGEKPDTEIFFQPFTLNGDGTQPLPGKHGVQFVIRPVRPKGRGTISADGRLDPKYFSTADEQEAMRRAVAYVKETLVKKAPLVPMVGALAGERVESSGVSGGSTSTVVNPENFMVKNMNNVYVCDSSILPVPLSGSTLPYRCVFADRFVDRLLNKQSVREKAESGGEQATARIVY